MKRFITGEYFLTHHQEKIKSEIIKSINQDSHEKRFSIAGSAGTGKTLLTYDIAKELIYKGRKVLVIHCATLNEGIHELNRTKNWKIVSIKNLEKYADAAQDYETIIIDESQRISIRQLKRVLSIEKCSVIFSHDKSQKLNKTNQAIKVADAITQTCEDNSYKLSTKIRHNKNLSLFIQKLFNLNLINSDSRRGNDFDCVKLYYTQDIKDARRHITHLRKTGWEHIYLTNSMYSKEPLDDVQFSSSTSSHAAIGQEYDNVVVTVTENFFHNTSNKISFTGKSYYNPIETLFQAATRTRKNICFVIIKNKDFLMNCVSILQNKKVINGRSE